MSTATVVHDCEVVHVESPMRISDEPPVPTAQVDVAILDPPFNTSVYLSWANWIPALLLPRVIWIGHTCSVLQRFWENRGTYLDRSIVMLTLILACFALWPSFSGAEDTRRATELAKWTAIKDFIEFCESHNSEPKGCNETELFLIPPPILRRKSTSAGESELELQGLQLTISLSQCITFLALDVLIACGVVISFRRRTIWSSFPRLRPKLPRLGLPLNAHLRTVTSHSNPIAEETKSTPPSAHGLHTAATSPRGPSSPDSELERAGLKRTVDQAFATGIDNYETKGTRRRKPSPDPENRKLACPFYKNDPSKCTESRASQEWGFLDVHRIKEHVYRFHTVPEHVCPRCGQEFFSDKEFTAHLEADVKCATVDFVPRHGIDRTQTTALRRRSRKGTVEEKWNEIYRIIFPDTPDDAIPSPYFDKRPPFDVQQYLRKELPSRLRREIEEELERKFNDPDDDMARKVVDLVQKFASADISRRLGLSVGEEIGGHLE